MQPTSASARSRCAATSRSSAATRSPAPSTSPFAALSAALPTAAHAGDSQVWGTATAQAGLGGNWRAHNELVVRDSDGRGFYEIEENLMVGYKADKHVTLWLGYTFNPLYNHGSHLITEQRFRQQISLDNVLALGPVRLGGRVRVEERWRPGFGGAITADNAGLGVRFTLSLPAAA